MYAPGIDYTVTFFACVHAGVIAVPALPPSNAHAAKAEDLCFLRQGQMQVAGRITEMMIFNGRKVYPQDIEVMVDAFDPAFRSNGCAAFAVEADDGTARPVIVQEVESRQQPALDQLAQRLRARLMAHHGIAGLAAIVLIKAAHLPRTSNGKTQRLRCRELFSGARFAPVRSWSAADKDRPQAEAAGQFLAARTEVEVEVEVAAISSAHFCISPIGIEDNFFELDGHSLLAVQLLVRMRGMLQR